MLKYVFSRPFLSVESVISLLVAEDGSCIEQGGKTAECTQLGKDVGQCAAFQIDHTDDFHKVP